MFQEMSLELLRLNAECNSVALPYQCLCWELNGEAKEEEALG